MMVVNTGLICMFYTDKGRNRGVFLLIPRRPLLRSWEKT